MRTEEERIPISKDVEFAAKILESYVQHPELWAIVCDIFESGDQDMIAEFKMIVEKHRAAKERKAN
ncbi:MAG: hypothetical protein ABFD98_15890 [Syntrophobacteraceae bacterium]